MSSDGTDVLYTLRRARSPAKSLFGSSVMALSLRFSDSRLTRPSNAPGLMRASLPLFTARSDPDVGQFALIHGQL